jgi:serine/threonine protein kinase/tetratricopeptide (TPR) repeat protein
MPPATDKMKAVFLAALDKATPVERAAFLDEACADDADLRRRVEALLQAHDQPDRLLDRPAAEHLGGERTVVPGAAGEVVSTVVPRAAGEPVGTVIAGRYTLLEAIGEGGMGTVWLAEQTEPVRRKVALKLIKAGMDSRQVLARFEAERQALALMDHPNIAKVLDGGATADGRPFFAMELVQGVPITEYCDVRRLTPKERLELFVPVCQAIQHAHQKGVIHRDIKPSNVLVARYDDKPVPKVIDFGVAKATGEPLTDHTINTGFGGLVGTPQYMSPEQATFNNLDIDTRTDVYSLGVLLYELLTGTPPFSRKELEEKGLLEILRVVREEEATRPSSKLSTADELPILSVNRGTEPNKLTALLRSDLDWIVMKALEKDRSRRYDTANSFAADINRYLSGEPVLAHPPSTAYRLKKFFRRNRPQVIAAGVVLVALVAGVVGTTLGLVEARRQEGIARGERDLAAARLTKLENGVEILGSVFANLDPTAEQRGGDSLGVALGKQLDRAAKELQGDAVGEPLVVARLQGTLGASLSGLGQYAKAIEVLESALATRAALLGDEHKDTLRLRINLANAYLNSGQPQRALELFERSIPALAGHLGTDSPAVLRGRASYATALVGARRFEEATRQLASVLKDYQAKGLGEDHQALIAENMLAYAYMQAGQFARAIPVLERILPVCERKPGPDHPDTLIIRNNLAMAYNQAGQYARCVPLQQRTYDALVVKLGDRHPTTLAAWGNLAKAKRDAGQIRDAVPIFERLLEIYEARDGPKHPSTLHVYNELGTSYMDSGQPDRAVPILEKALAIWQSLHKEDGPDEVVVRGNLANAYQQAGQYARSIPLYEKNLAVREKHPDRDPAGIINERSNLAVALGETGEFGRAVGVLEKNLTDAEAKLGVDDPMTLTCRHLLARACRNAGQLARGLSLHERNLPLAVARLGEEHRYIIFFRVHLAVAQRENGDLTKALPTLETAVGQAQRRFGPTHLETLRITWYWCDALEQAKDLDRALEERQRVLAIERQRRKDDPRLATALVKVGQTFLAAGRAAEAERPLGEALTIQKRSESDRWTTFETQSMLGGALSRQKKYADAAPLLLAGHEGLKQRAASIPAQQKRCLTEAVERLVQHFEATGNKDEAARWRAALEKATTP